ncbi:hypothetical protein BD779DRAFT_1796681 [Infundibulicybe gibba]|nr:hypothetical protein BD779DRAFT_1796681 [Infundibulicybe gibba]
MSVSSTQTFGAIEVGVILAALANGVLAVQVNRYFHKPGKDPLFLKLLAATVAHLFLGAAILHILTITNHSSLKPISETMLPAAFPVEPVLEPSSTLHIYLSLHKLTNRWLFPVVCWTLSAYVLGSGIANSVIISTGLMGALTFPARWNWFFYSYYSAAAGVDILIAASTCWTWSRVAWLCEEDTRLVNQIMLRTVQTGVATSVVAVCTLIVFVTHQPSNIWLALYLPLTPLYPITLLALFNGRVGIKGSKVQTIEISVESRIHFDDEVGEKSTRMVGAVDTTESLDCLASLYSRL